MRSVKRGAGGFTFIELLLASVLGVVVLGGAYMVYEAGWSTQRAGARRANLQQNARAALDALTWQIRQAGYLNLGTTANWIVIGTPTLLVVRGDLRGANILGTQDTLFGIQPAQTAFCLAPPCLMSGDNVYTVDAAQTALSFNSVTNVAFTYFDANDTALAAPLDGVGPGAYPNGSPYPSPVPAGIPVPGPTTDRNQVCRIQLQLTAVDNNVGPSPGVGSAVQQIVLTADVRLRNAPRTTCP